MFACRERHKEVFRELRQHRQVSNDLEKFCGIRGDFFLHCTPHVFAIYSHHPVQLLLVQL